MRCLKLTSFTWLASNVSASKPKKNINRFEIDRHFLDFLDFVILILFLWFVWRWFIRPAVTLSWPRIWCVWPSGAWLSCTRYPGSSKSVPISTRTLERPTSVKLKPGCTSGWLCSPSFWASAEESTERRGKETVHFGSIHYTASIRIELLFLLISDYFELSNVSLQSYITINDREMGSFVGGSGSDTAMNGCNGFKIAFNKPGSLNWV